MTSNVNKNKNQRKVLSFKCDKDSITATEVAPDLELLYFFIASEGKLHQEHNRRPSYLLSDPLKSLLEIGIAPRRLLHLL